MTAVKSTSRSKTQPRRDFVTGFARVSSVENTAKTLANVLAESLENVSVAAFENATGTWDVELHMAGGFDENAIRDLIRATVGDAVVRTLQFGDVAERDWVASSLAGLKPVAAGRFLIHGSHDREQTRGARIPIEIEAALAFGTGHHGTTRGCLIAFDRLLRARHPRHVLDVGTGTGVLAIAAAKALHHRVVATDIDKVAVKVARDNAMLNHIAPLFADIHARGVNAHAI